MFLIILNLHSCGKTVCWRCLHLEGDKYNNSLYIILFFFFLYLTFLSLWFSLKFLLEVSGALRYVLKPYVLRVSSGTMDTVVSEAGFPATMVL